MAALALAWRAVAGADGLAQLQLEGVVDLGQVLGRELDVDHWADDLGDAASVAPLATLAVERAGAVKVMDAPGMYFGLAISAVEDAIASAAEAISVTSRVMFAWRTLL